MVDIDFYSRVYDGVLEDDVCQEYINMFEETQQIDGDKRRKLSVCYDNSGKKLCGNCDCERTNPFEYERFAQLNQHTMKKMQEVISQYRDDCQITNIQWPKKYGFEEPNIKKFKVDSTIGHGMEMHSDIWSFAHSKRILGILVYLNGGFSEGETYFPLFDVKVQPSAGRALVFPSSWDYIHCGLPPRHPATTEAKYFIMFHTVFLDEGVQYPTGINRTDRQSLGNYEYLRT